MVAWPPDLPEHQFVGLVHQRQDNRARSSIEDGPGFMRPRGEAIARPQQAPIILTGAQRAIFNDFFANVLREGVLPFDWTDPASDRLVRFRFVQSPDFTLDVGGSTSGRVWSATLSLETLPALDLIPLSVLEPPGFADVDLFGSPTRGGVDPLLQASFADADLFGDTTVAQVQEGIFEPAGFADVDLYGDSTVQHSLRPAPHVEVDLFGTSTAQGQDILVSRRQLKQSDSGSVTLDEMPLEGNLLVAVSYHRAAGEMAFLSGSGWALRVLRTEDLGDTEARQGIAVWTKVAGGSEPQTITATWNPSTNSRLLVQEFAADRLVTWQFLAAAHNDTPQASLFQWDDTSFWNDSGSWQE